MTERERRRKNERRAEIQGRDRIFKGSKALEECRDFVNFRRLSRVLSVLNVRDGEGRSRNLQRRGAIQGRDRII